MIPDENSAAHPHLDTELVHHGRDSEQQFGFVNAPPYRGSTVVHKTLASLDEATRADAHTGDFIYGLLGTPNSRELEGLLAKLDGGAGAVVVQSGLAAVHIAIASHLSHGDHVLMVDTTYGPTRRICDEILPRMGVSTTYYDPSIDAGIDALVQPNTKLIYMESPGSLTFEVQDVRAISEIARARGVLSVVDATWAPALFCRPIELGADFVVRALTKYEGGSSDLLLGAVIARTRELLRPVKVYADDLGSLAHPEDCVLCLRGMRSLSVRLQHHQASALHIAHWLQSRSEVARVFYPALETDPNHTLWKRDFTGATGLFSVELHPTAREDIARMLDGMRYFRMGYSWGGFESLIILAEPGKGRTASRWRASGPLLRLHIGLEHVRDLIADLEDGFKRMS
ncbi:MAG: cystathionine beta-lyase [Phycisphaerales bacterium]|nr:cystathionine beta-lyase [Phycisphaerales bacterium]